MSTMKMVKNIREMVNEKPKEFENKFDRIGKLVKEAEQNIQNGNIDEKKCTGRVDNLEKILFKSC